MYYKSVSVLIIVSSKKKIPFKMVGDPNYKTEVQPSTCRWDDWCNAFKILYRSRHMKKHSIIFKVIKIMTKATLRLRFLIQPWNENFSEVLEH